MDIELLKRKSLQIDRAMLRIRSKFPESVEIFESSYDAQDIVYRNFVVVVQNCVDMGGHIIAEKNWETPQTMRDVFRILEVQAYLPSDMSRWLMNMVTVRNIIVHDYSNLDHQKAFNLIKTIISVVPPFCLLLIDNAQKDAPHG